MSGKQISLIYFYLVSAASLALIVIGVFSIVNFVINVSYYDKYPLQYYEEDCSDPYRFGPMTSMPVEGGKSEASLSAEEKKELKVSCERRVEGERTKRKVDDLKNVITFSIIGAILFLIHFPQARKQSKS